MRGKKISKTGEFPEQHTRKPKLETIDSKLPKIKKTEIVPLEEKSILETSFNAISDWILLSDLDGRIIKTNKAGEKFTGLSCAEIIGKSCCKLIHNSKKQLPGCLVKQMISTGSRASSEFQVSDGNWISVTVEPVKDKENNIKGVVHIIRDITQRKSEEKKLRDSEEKFRRIFKHAHDGITYLDCFGKILDVNEKVIEIFEGTREDLLNKHFTKLGILFAKDIPKYLSLFQSILSGRERNVTVKIQSKKGREMFLECSASLIKSDGEPTRIMVIVRDITERRKAEEALRISEERFKGIFENSLVGIYRTTPDGRILMANPAIVKMLGYNSFEELEKRNLEKYGFTQKQPHSEFIKKIESRGKIIGYESEWCKKDGSSLFVRESTRIIRDKDGNTLYYEGTVEDITERKKAEERLLDSEKRFRTLFESTREGVISVTPEGRIVKVNPAAAKILGHKNPKDMIGMYTADFYADMQQRKYVMKELEEKGYLQDFEIVAKRRDGTRGYMLASASIQRDEEGNVTQTDVIFRDITERKQVEDILRESERLLNEVGNIAKIGGWEMDLITRKAKWTKGTYDIVEIGYDEPVPGPDEHVDYYLPEHRSIVENAMIKLIEDDIPLDFEAKLKTAKGNIKWCRAIGRAVRKNGVCIKIFGTFQDVTEIKKAKKKIEELAKFPEENPDPVLRITENGIIIYGNKASTVILKTWGKKIGESLPEVYLKRAKKVLISGEILIDEFECDNGRIFELIFTPIQEHGYVNIYGQDITQRKYIEDSLLKYHEQLKSLASKLTITEERERNRIATELHDHICQSLAISKIKLETLMSSKIADDAYDILSEVCNWITQVINDTRTLTFDLSSPILHELGFEKAVAAWLEDEIQLKHNIQTEFYCDHLSKPLDNDVRSLLFRDVRELLINIVKHAHAKTVKVSINRNANRIRVVVEDDGVGFDPVQVTAVAMSRAEFGLFSIRQRLEFLGGQFEINSSPGRGCKITMIAPLKEVIDSRL